MVAQASSLPPNESRKTGSSRYHPIVKSRRTLRVGLIGYGFMGRAHSNAWRQAPRFFDLPANVRMSTLCGRNARALKKAAATLGWEKSVTDWRAVVNDPEIDIIDISTPNDLHAEIAIAAAVVGKAILCEKPLARDVGEAERMAAAVRKARVVNMVCHNYRRVPALALAREMITRGELGDRLYHYRARYAQDWIADPQFPLVWRLRAEAAGSGSLGDIGSHIIDLARYPVGEFREVCAMTETFVKQRPLGRTTRLSRDPRHGKRASLHRALVAARAFDRLRAQLRAHDCRFRRGGGGPEKRGPNLCRWPGQSARARGDRVQRAAEKVDAALASHQVPQGHKER